MKKPLSTEALGHQDPKPSDLVWVKGSPSVASVGLARALQGKFRIHREQKPPAAPESPSAVLCCLDGSEQEEDIASLVQSVKEEVPEAAVVVLSPTLELSLTCAAVSAGARGFLPAGISPQQLARAISVVLRGEMALPREILETFVKWLNERREAADLSTLSERK